MADLSDDTKNDIIQYLEHEKFIWHHLIESVVVMIKDIDETIDQFRSGDYVKTIRFLELEAKLSQEKTKYHGNKKRDRAGQRLSNGIYQRILPWLTALKRQP